jgi:hypothetical protein
MFETKNKTFIAPQNAAEPEEITLESVLNAFGVQQTPPANTDPPAGDPPAATETDPPAGDDPPATDPPPADPNNPPETNNNDDPPLDKSAQKFAEMRVQNKNYQKIISGVAQILGVTDQNPDNVMNSLNDLVLKAQAKKENIPEDVYKRLQTLEQRDQEYTQKEIREAAYFGFQQVKDTFKLDNQKLNDFATELQKNGMNPFEQQVDLVKEYRNMHFDEMLQAAVAEGIRQEAERAANAANHSSTPNNKQGQGGADPEKITTVAQLDSWFNKQNVK